jgi:hypothetical protein
MTSQMKNKMRFELMKFTWNVSWGGGHRIRFYRNLMTKNLAMK